MKWQYFVVTPKDCFDHICSERQKTAAVTREDIRHWTKEGKILWLNDLALVCIQPTKRDCVLQNIPRQRSLLCVALTLKATRKMLIYLFFLFHFYDLHFKWKWFTSKWWFSVRSLLHKSSKLGRMAHVFCTIFKAVFKLSIFLEYYTIYWESMRCRVDECLSPCRRLFMASVQGHVKSAHCCSLWPSVE